PVARSSSVCSPLCMARASTFVAGGETSADSPSVAIPWGWTGGRRSDGRRPLTPAVQPPNHPRGGGVAAVYLPPRPRHLQPPAVGCLASLGGGDSLREKLERSILDSPGDLLPRRRRRSPPAAAGSLQLLRALRSAQWSMGGRRSHRSASGAIRRESRHIGALSGVRTGTAWEDCIRGRHRHAAVHRSLQARR